MPKIAVSYENVCFYRIVCNDLDITDCYVGHTTNFAKRKYQHKTTCNNSNDANYNFPIYQFIRDNGGWDNWDMILIEHCKCESSLDAKKKEREYMEQLKATFNRNIPSRTEKEYREDTKEKKSERMKKYREDNRDKIRESAKNYYEQNKEQVVKNTRYTIKTIRKSYMSKTRNTGNIIKIKKLKERKNIMNKIKKKFSSMRKKYSEKKIAERKSQDHKTMD